MTFQPQQYACILNPLSLQVWTEDQCNICDGFKKYVPKWVNFLPMEEWNLIPLTFSCGLESITAGGDGVSLMGLCVKRLGLLPQGSHVMSSPVEGPTW